MDIRQRQADRLRFLKEVYDVTGGNPDDETTIEEVAGRLGFDENYADQIEAYLVREGLIQRPYAGHIALSHDGLNEVEAALETPDEPTEHFPPISVFQNYGTMIGSPVQQATVQSQQSVQQTITPPPELGQLLAELRDALDRLDLPDAQRDELRADVETAQAQVGSPRPKRSILAECLGSIRRVLEGAVANVAANATLATG